MPEFDEPQFLEALLGFIERMDWFTVGRSPEEGLETNKVKLLLAEWDEQVAPWRGCIPDAEMRAHFEQLTPFIDKARARLRLMFLVTLHNLIETRFKWLLWEMAVRAPARVKTCLAAVTPEERVRLLAATREILGKDLDTAEMFQEAMEQADAGEAAWKKDFDQFRKEWSDECTPKMAAELLKTDARAAAALMNELLGDIPKQVRLLEGFVTHTYSVAVSVCKRADDLGEAALVWEHMGGFCTSALSTLTRLKDRYPDCGTPALSGLTLDYKLACEKRFRSVMEEIECQNQSLPTGLFPATI